MYIHAEELGDRKRLLQACSNLGECYRVENQLGKAIKVYKQGMGIAKEISDRFSEQHAHNNLGVCYWMLGEYD